MTRRPFLLCLALFPTLAAAQATPAPGFDCNQAYTTAEHLICADPALALADHELGLWYRAVQKKPTRPATLRQEQRRWLREVRDACLNADCLRQAYAVRTRELRALNTQPLDWRNAPFDPVFERAIPLINDTRVVRGLRLRAEVPTALQLELHVDPQDHLAWRAPGPRVQIVCTEPERREGYAGRFEYRAQAHGLDFVAVQRGQGLGFVLMTLEIGKTLPVNEDIACAVGFSEWLLDQPSRFYVVRR